MGRVGWAIGSIIVLMVIGLIMMGEAEKNARQQTIDCEYETKYVDGKAKRVLDCD